MTFLWYDTNTKEMEVINMKNHRKFILSTLSIILGSVLLLVGCMAAITASPDTPHPYQLATIPTTSPDTGGISNKETTDQSVLDHEESIYQSIRDREEALYQSILEHEEAVYQSFLDYIETKIDPALKETPVSQEELKAKFSSMYDFSKGNKTVSVISETYLKDFWRSNEESEVVHSLSIPEVLYIIQDSIRIYNEYDTIILPGFSANTSNEAISIRFPVLEQQTITPNPDDRDRAREDIRNIIQYRLRALSSPKSFFTIAEMMEYRKMNLEPVPEICLDVFFYIPNYSADTNRHLYLQDANYYNSRSKYGVFCFSYFNRIVLFSYSNPEPVFPTKELSLEVQEQEVIYLEMDPHWILDTENFDKLLGIRSFVLDPEAQTFYITTTGARYNTEKNCIVLEKDCPDFKKWPGTYQKIGNRLYLYPVDIPDGVLVFDYCTDGSLRFNNAESNQIELAFKDQSIFQPVVSNP